MTAKPRLLDLFCGAGGSAVGYHRAGFDVVGVDIRPQPRYPFTFVQADALEFPLDGFDAIHASPPCQHYSNVTGRNRRNTGRYPNFVPPTLARLRGLTVPWVVENVRGAPLPGAIMLCGSSFGLDVRRHRCFESNVAILSPPCNHAAQRPRFRSLDSRQKTLATVVGVHGHLNYPGEFELRCQAMGIDWMTNDELSEAIPPSFTAFIGGLLLAHLSRAGASRAVDHGPPISSSPTRHSVAAPGGAANAPALDALWRPAFVDNDARPVPTTRETVRVKGGVL